MFKWREDCCGCTEMSGVILRQWRMETHSPSFGEEGHLSEKERFRKIKKKTWVIKMELKRRQLKKKKKNASEKDEHVRHL